MKLTQRKIDLLACVPMVPLFIIVASVSSREKAFAVIVTMYLFYVIISQKWNSRKSLMFWVVIGAFAIMHILAITFVRFPSEIRPAVIIFPAALLDVLAMYATIAFVERRISSGTG